MALIKRHYTDNETIITAKNMNDIQDAILALEEGLLSVDDTRSGEAITITDAASRGLRSLKIYGKTTQGGTPTPEAPVDLVSSSEENGIAVHVSGKNLFTGWEVGGIASGDGSDSASDTKRRTGYLPVFSPGQRIAISGIPGTLYSMAVFYDANKAFISRSAAGNYAQRLIDSPANAKYFRVTVYESSTASGTIAEADAMARFTMIEAGGSYTEYEQGKPIQTALISSPNGLRGFPVSSGGNYEDATGQQWICDEIDLKRGVYVKRIGRVTLNGSENWLGYLVTEVNQFHVAVPSVHMPNERGAMCKYYKPIIISQRSLNYGTIYTYNGGIAINTQECATVTEWKALLATRPITVLYVLAAPVETDLTAADIEAYTALQTHKEQTTVSNNGHAYMELEYVMDTKKYIDRLAGGGVASARLTEVVLSASAWTGTDNLHSQVVAIADITPYSKVDLLPSVEQLAIFHNKDVAFVTENEDGVVTVYAIGDKPTLDYTIQVSITEVIA